MKSSNHHERTNWSFNGDIWFFFFRNRLFTNAVQRLHICCVVVALCSCHQDWSLTTLQSCYQTNGFVGIFPLGKSQVSLYFRMTNNILHYYPHFGPKSSSVEKAVKSCNNVDWFVWSKDVSLNLIAHQVHFSMRFMIGKYIKLNDNPFHQKNLVR